MGASCTRVFLSFSRKNISRYKRSMSRSFWTNNLAALTSFNIFFSTNTFAENVEESGSENSTHMQRVMGTFITLLGLGFITKLGHLARKIRR